MFAVLVLTACEGEVGTQTWCDHLKEKPKREWRAKDALDFSEHCILNAAIGSDKWCQDLSRKDKGDWTAREASSYAKHCLL